MKVALVTGASRGIGRAIATSLASSGVTVAVHYDKSVDAALEVVNEITKSGGSAQVFQASLGQPDAPADLVQRVAKEFGAINILINNAAVMTDGSIAEMSDAMWDETIAVNLSAVFKLSRACIPAMVANKWGRIISISSQVAHTGSANHAHYSATKAALLGFSYSAAKELGVSGITANVVVPGRIDTDMISVRSVGRMDEWMAQTPLGRLGTPNEVASVVNFLASNDASYITGAAINVNGGLVMG
jgi:NAD(P)-dependent dehydrogenase (short-subunit alcohol dehydrogenase family)